MRTAGSTLTAAIAALALAACGGGGDDRARTVSAPSPEDEAPTTTEPVATESQKSPEAEAPPAFSEAMLTLNDMPSGWTTAPELLEEDDSDDSGGFCGTDEDPLNLEEETERTSEAAFKQSDFGPFVFHAAGELSSGDRTAEALDQFLDVANGCSEWTETEDDGTETTWRLSPLSFPNLGDESVAFRMSSQAEGMSATFDLVMWHDGSRLAVLAYIAIGGGTDAELFEQLALTAADRL